MFAKFYARKARPAAAPVFVAIDNLTGREIARGSQDEMTAFQIAFRLCHIAPAA